MWKCGGQLIGQGDPKESAESTFGPGMLSRHLWREAGGLPDNGRLEKNIAIDK